MVKLLLESLKAKRERDWKAKEEAEKDLPKSECAQGSTSSREEPEEKLEELEGKKEEAEEEKIDYDTVDLQSLWDQCNFDSEGDHESLSSTECNDPEPIILKQFEAFDRGKTKVF